jgi:hypothetical protein
MGVAKVHGHAARVGTRTTAWDWAPAPVPVIGMGAVDPPPTP